MSLDHNAILKAYPNAVVVDDGIGVLDSSGNSISIDQSLVDAARIELNKLNYQLDRTSRGSIIYASIGDQLDMLYHDMVAGKLDSTGTWFNHVKSVKDSNPKL